MSIAFSMKKIVASGAAALLVASGLAAVTVIAAAPSVADTPVATTGPGPIQQPAANNVTADALPTVQIDGVAWAQVVVGNTVYVGGSFANARPAGAAAGVNTTPRADMLAYNLTTGALITTFNPVFNNQVRALAVSPDGTRLYAVGDFTTVNGVVHNRIVAFDTTTGSIVTSFTAGLDAGAKAVIATNSTVYVGGLFANADGVAHTRLAAFSAANGAVTTWNASADYTVNALVLTPDGTKVIAGGAFANLDGLPAYGMGALDANTGALLPWNATSIVQDAGQNAAITSLSTDGTAIYGTGYVFGAGGNVEGTFSADPSTGNLNWLEDCHGDSYDAFPVNGIVYTVSHAHFCGNDGGWPVYNPWQYRHTVAFTANATGTLLHNSQGGYADFYGTPSPSIINWFPDYTTGTYTGQNQAAWSVSGNSQYIVEGGEFPTVNGTAQQGLVRFAVRPIAPAKSGPQVTGAHFAPTLVSLATGTVRVSFPSNWDRDSKTLTYQVVRNSNTANPVWTTTADSEWWNQPVLGFTDTGLTPGATYKYRVYATDPDGNTVAGDTVSITVPAAGTETAYDQQVIADGASSYWPLSEASGTTLIDDVNFNDMDVTGTVTRGTTGPVSGENATTFDGSTASASTRTAIQGPNTFTLSTWVRTTSTSGGKIVGFGNAQTGASSNYDRQIYLDNSGHVLFGVYNNAVSTLQSTQTINDGQWHQIVASLGPNGMALYVDGARVATRSDVTFGQAYAGYWRIGGDSLNGWTNQPSSFYLAGDIADVAVFPTVISRQTVQSEYVASGRTATVPAAPTDKYGKAVYADNPDIYWRLDDASGPTALDASPNMSNGIYSGGETFLSPSTVTGPNGTGVTFNGVDGTVASQQQFVNPTVYSEEAWFNTQTVHGGKIMGFGDAQTGNSSNYDRHVYMLDNGQLVFGTWTGQQNLAQTTASYNDGNWHQVVATQGPDGMKLYVDGQLVATNPQTQAQAYNGYWRVGGDSSWGGDSNYFAGEIDEAAFFSTQELTAAQIQTEYAASSVAVNVPPTASFTQSCTGAVCSFDGTGSTDVDGTVTGYSWNFGDNSALGSGATPSHTYTQSGTYSVTLTVTDNGGATNSVTNQVAVTVPPVDQPPVASFTATVTNLSVALNAAASSDPDGTIASYAWSFDDGGTATGVTASHTFTTAGAHTVTLTVTDNQNVSTSSTQNVTTTLPPNQPPTAAFTQSCTGAVCSFDGTGSTDVDGTVTGYSWNFGDNSALGSGATPSHTYTQSGTYSVTLTVTDNGGATNSVTNQVAVTVPPVDQPPVASFTATVTNLSVALNAAASSDPDGTIASYAWSFDDGGTATGVTASHTFTTAGAHTVTLTVTDNQNVSTSSTQSVTTTAPASGTVVASDAFGRTVASGWGAADLGGSWTLNGSAALFSVAGGVGKIKLAAAGAGPSAFLNGVSARDVTGIVDVTFDSVPTGGGTIVYLAERHVGTTDYRLQVKVLASSITVYLTKVVAGATTVLTSKTIAQTYSLGDVLRLKLQVSGASPTTLSGKVWKVGTTEPAAFQVTATDSEPTLQGAGGVGVQAYLSGSSTTVPVNASFDNLNVATGVGVANQPPTAAFTDTVSNQTVSFNAATSSDPDGTIASYAWNFGDNSASGSGVAPTHTYTTAGPHTVTLTVTDNGGAVATVSQTVTTTAAANQPPTAAFTDTVTNLSVAFDGTTSSDPNGPIASYAWTFGDGTNASGATVTHTYAVAGNYSVVLTVTDGGGLTAFISQTVVVAGAGVTVDASDAFGRTVASGWGAADLGGSWTLNGSAALFSVAGGVGKIKLAAAGAGPSAFLNGVSARDVTGIVDVTFDSVPTGGGTIVYLAERHVGTTDYRLQVKVLASSITVYLTKVVAGATTVLTSKTIAQTYSLGDVLRLKLQVSGASPTTLSGKVWKVGTTEPAAFQVTATDSEPTLQGAGGVGVQAYLSGSSTTVPVNASFDNLNVTT